MLARDSGRRKKKLLLTGGNLERDCTLGVFLLMDEREEKECKHVIKAGNNSDLSSHRASSEPAIKTQSCQTTPYGPVCSGRLAFRTRRLFLRTAEKRQISGAVTMSPGNTVQPVVKSIQDACVQQPSHVTLHTALHTNTHLCTHKASWYRDQRTSIRTS